MSEDLNTLYDGQDFPENEHPLDTQQSPVGHNRKLAPKTIEQYQYFVKVLRRSLLKASPPDTLQEDIQPSDLVDHSVYYLVYCAHQLLYFRPRGPCCSANLGI